MNADGTLNGSNQWTFAYDGSGNLQTSTNPLTQPTTYAYCSATDQPANLGMVKTVTDALNHVTTYNSDDPSGRPTQITDAAGEVTQFGYDSMGPLLWVQWMGRPRTSDFGLVNFVQAAKTITRPLRPAVTSEPSERMAGDDQMGVPASKSKIHWPLVESMASRWPMVVPT